MIMSEDMFFIRLFVIKNIINVRVLYVNVSNQVVATVDETNPGNCEEELPKKPVGRLSADS